MAAAGLAVVGGIVGALGAASEAESKAKAAEFNAKVNQENADEAILQSQKDEKQQRTMAYQTIGQTKASYGASGVGASGSMQDVIQDSFAKAELDALNIRHSGEMKAWAYKKGAQLDQMNAGAARIAGQYAVASSLINAGSSAAKMGSSS